MLYRVLTLALAGVLAACSGTDDPNAGQHQQPDPDGQATATQLVVSELVADLAGAEELILFAADSDAGAAPAMTATVEVTGAGPVTGGPAPTEPTAGAVFKRLANDRLQPLFNQGLDVEDLIVGGAVAWLGLRSPALIGAATATEVAALWCNQVAFATTNETARAWCIEPPDANPSCHDPSSPEIGVPDGPCDPYGGEWAAGPARVAAVSDDGTVWVLYVDANEDANLYAYDQGTSYQATPVPVQGVQGLLPAAGGVLLVTDGRLEGYALDRQAGTVRFRNHARSLLLLNGLFISRQNPIATVRWGDRIMLEPEPASSHDWDHAWVQTATAPVVASGLSFTPPLSDDHDVVQEVLSDGENLYVRTVSAGTNETDRFWRCPVTSTCAPVSALDTARLSEFFPETAAATDRLWGQTDGLAWVVGPSGAWFLADGVVSDNVASDWVIRKSALAGQAFVFEGVNQDNEGGLFRVRFDTSTRTFTTELVETYGLAVDSLIELGLGEP